MFFNTSSSLHTIKSILMLSFVIFEFNIHSNSLNLRKPNISESVFDLFLYLLKFTFFKEFK